MQSDQGADLYTLYYAPDNASLVIRVVLEEIGAAYNTWLVDRTAREQESEAYRKLNPAGLIPVCIIDGEPVFETAAIALTLADRHGQLAPAPQSSDRPAFLKWLFFLSNTLHPDLRQLFYPQKFIDPDPATLSMHARKTRNRLEAHFGILEALYSGFDHPFLLGAEPTIFDIYAGLCLRWPQLYPAGSPPAFVPADYPVLSRMLQALEVRPSFKRAFEAEGIPAPFLSEARPCDGSLGSPV
ncbi:glutathione S-transferase family protein [Hoeflea poritis]|uniref:Glutathione S-transferase family protein n=1 Tax=Hoeflea poritis TaxID=2993659 RepID=A0ABT4VH76_9HYPH|nr:glutathione S-transferase family protein [Hoeflea poritis]MDA4844066.1 glutathione S-transferase family protein [Hoeflea poritis]